MELRTVRIGTYRPRGFGFKVFQKDGRLLVTTVSTDGAAFLGGLRADDIIQSINGKIVDICADDFVSIMNQSSGEVLLSVLRPSAQPRRSYGNLSTASNQSSSGSSLQKLTTSMSAMDLNTSSGGHQLLDSSYVPEALIDAYLQPTRDEPHEPLAITRKQAYRRAPGTASGETVAPRIQVKRANKAASFLVAGHGAGGGREAAFVVKKRTNTANSSPRMPLARPSQHALPGGAAAPTPSPSGDGPPAASLLLSPVQSQSQSPAEGPGSPQEDVVKPESLRLEVSLKVLSFKEKIRKPLWQQFSLEQDSFGLLFHCLDLKERPVPCNSTAIDPYVSGMGIFMELWASNNTASRFLLPVGRAPFSAEIEVLAASDCVLVRYPRFDLEFQVSVSRLPEDAVPRLYSLLGLKHEPREPKPPPPPPATKQKRSQGSMDNIKFEYGRTKPRGKGSDSPRPAFLSRLPQTRLVENVPLVVIVCVSLIERLGLRREGVYRMPGNEALRRRLEALVGAEGCARWADCEDWANVNAVASLLKSVLRSSGALVDRDTAIKLSMINLVGVEDGSRAQVYMDMVYHLRQHLCRPNPETRCRLDTFKYLLKHLDRVGRHQRLTKMGPENLATCLSPTIIEDIPCDGDDGDDYQTSKKSEADKNLKQMVTFWISNADLICELLEEDDERRRYERLSFFCQEADSGRACEAPEPPAVPDDEVAALVREQVDYYASSAFLPAPETSGTGTEAATAAQPTPELNSFARLKNLGAYRSYKMPRKTGVTRRSSTSLSPHEERKKAEPEAVPRTEVRLEVGRGISPGVQKKLDNWTARSFRGRKREPLLPPKRELSLTAMRISGVTKNVPLVIDVCVTIIARHGLDVDGVYRISGKKQDIDLLEDLVVESRHLRWPEECYLGLWSNVYVVSCLLKAVLKRLCLIRKETWVHMFSQFSERMEAGDVRQVLMAAAYHLRHERKRPKLDIMANDYLDRVQKECEDDIRSATLRYVLRHLKAVSRHASSNRMATNSLAVCFVPVLLEEDASGNLISINSKGIQLLEKLIDHCDWIFQWDDKPCEAMYGQMMTDSLDEYLRRYSVTETSSRAPRMDEETIAQSIVAGDSVQRLLEELISRSRIVAQNRVTIRRHSDGTEVPLLPPRSADNAEVGPQLPS